MAGKEQAPETKEELQTEEGAEQAEQPKKSKKKLLIIILAILLLVGGGAGVFLSGILHKGGVEEKKTEDMVEKIIYFDMDEFLVNLNNPGNQVSFLKTTITLELPNQASMKEVEEKMPRIRDTFQIYLREMRNSDLQGSAGLQRLRTELLMRINGIMDKGKVNKVLFKEIVVQ
ncbi:MAG TPA: flagellar basal body protein FliL [Alphaproteobacteria bacterium]|nr:flagellar basal body protein FliL [Alphaproteobacteria bacterium]